MIGIQATSSTINQQLGQTVISLRNACQDAANLQEYVVSLGTAGLEAIGFSATDAASVLQMCSYMNTIAGVFNGSATQSTEFNFGNALSAVTGGN